MYQRNVAERKYEVAEEEEIHKYLKSVLKQLTTVIVLQYFLIICICLISQHLPIVLFVHIFDVGQEGLALTRHSNSSQRCLIGLRSGLCAGQSSSSTPNFVIIPLTADCGIFRSEEISLLDLLHRRHPITVPRWNSLSP